MPLLPRPKRKSQSDLLDVYSHEVDRTRQWRQNEGYDVAWKAMVNAYRGKGILPEGSSQEDRILINQAFATINVIYPSISIARPKITVNPTRPEFDDRSWFAQAMVNYQWSQYGVHDEVREAIKDSLIVGHGWVKCVWAYEEYEREITEEEFAEQFVERLRINEEEERGETDEEIAASIQAQTATDQVDRPIVARISPHNMFVNPEATSLRDARWIAQRVIRHIDDAKSDPSYSKAERDKLEGGYVLDGEDTPRSDLNQSKDLVEVWEFYDLRRGTMCVFSNGSSGYLIKPRQIPFAFGHPYEMIGNYKIPEYFYPIGDLEMILPLVSELSKTRSEMMNHRARHARKYVARKSAISRNDWNKIASKQDGVVIGVEDDQYQLDDVIRPLDTGTIDPGLYNWSEIINDDIQGISGVSEFARGAAPQVRRTATEAALLQDAQNARSAEKLDRVEDFMARVAKKLLQLNQQFVSGPQVARLMGRDGANIWVPYTREDIKGFYEFQVEAGSTQPKNETYRRQAAIGLLQALAPFIQLQAVNVPELLRHVLRDGFDIRNPERFLQNPQQNPQAPTPVQPGAGGGPAGADAPQPNPAARAEANAAADMDLLGGA